MRTLAISLTLFGALIACEARQPEAFEGMGRPRIGTPKDTADKDDDDKATPSKSEPSSDTSEPTPTPPTPTPAPTTPPKPPEPPPKNCTAETTFDSCTTCCDEGGVYPAFLTRFDACGADATCKTTESQACFASPACTKADKCMLANDCWNKPKPE